MSITFQFPTSWSLSERKNASLGNCNVRVNDAFIIFLLMASVFQSPNIPDGMSIDTMVAPDSFIIWITDTYPLDGSGDFSPVPKRPSITKSSGPSIGRSKFFMTSVNLDPPAARKRSLLSRQSGCSLLPPMLNRYTSGM